jgi:hypothetical protein
MGAELSEREFEVWAEALRTEYDAFLRQSWAAMQAARKGHWIEDTEEVVRDAGEVFRQKALEKLLQMQVAAGQGSFSPSGGGLGQQGSADSHAPDGGGARAGATAGMAPARRRHGGAGG